jgi:hypothetical protein
VTTLDLFSRDHHIGGTAFLKIDVEGGEYLALQGAQEFLRANPEVCIIFESDPEWCRRAGYRQQDAFELLRRLGFGLYALRLAEPHSKVAGQRECFAYGRNGVACRDADLLPII